MGQHDLAHKEFYSHPENIKDLIQGFVALDCISEFDFNTLERDNASYVEKENGERHDDIIWRLKWRGSWVYVYILLEFQSNVDETMPIRIMSYVALLYLSLLNNEKLGYGKEKKLPIVLPIVLYNGKDIWNVSKNIQDLIENTSDEKLQKFIPKLSYYFIDEIRAEANEKDTVFNGLANSVVATMKLQRTLSNEEFDQFALSLKKLFKDNEQKIRFTTFMAFMRRFLSIAYNHEKFNSAKNLNEVIRMVKTFVDYERENNLEEGRKEGIKEGKKEGMLNTLYKLIKNGCLTIDDAAKNIGISIDELLAGFKKYNLTL